jgi:hypothetical protein
METEKIVREILAELSRAKSRFPEWPTDPIHAAAIIQEETGELIQATLQFSYDHKSGACLANEAIQVGAMVVRFLNNYEHYLRVKPPQRED